MIPGGQARVQRGLWSGLAAFLTPHRRARRIAPMGGAPFAPQSCCPAGSPPAGSLHRMDGGHRSPSTNARRWSRPAWPSACEKASRTLSPRPESSQNGLQLPAQLDREVTWHRDLTYDRLVEALPSRPDYRDAPEFDPTEARYFELVRKELELTDGEVEVFRRRRRLSLSEGRGPDLLQLEDVLPGRGRARG